MTSLMARLKESFAMLKAPVETECSECGVDVPDPAPYTYGGRVQCSGEHQAEFQTRSII